jgi:hypothetical protein
MAKWKTGEERKVEATAGTSDFLLKYRSLVSADDILAAGMRLGAIERQRKIDLPKLVEATILALGPIPGAQMTAFENYLALAGQEVAPSSFYDRFSPGFAALMKEVAGNAVKAVGEMTPEGSDDSGFGVLLEQFKDVRITDSTAHFLKRFAKAWARSTSKVRPSAVKLHVTISLQNGLPTHSAITEQRVHDNKAFPEDAMEPGTLHLFDLGYIDVARFIEMGLKEVTFLTRLKDSHNPKIVRVHVGKGSRVACRGSRIDDALRDGNLLTENGLIDLDVQLAAGGKSCIARVVGVVDEADNNNIHWYLTSVPREVLDARDVAETYRLRWIIELVNKQLKSGLGLDSILAWREPAVTALMHAKIVALCLARLMEITVQAKDGTHIIARLAMVLVLARTTGLFIAHRLMAEGVTIEEFERRIMLIATVAARTRNQRREREKRKREAALGR